MVPKCLAAAFPPGALCLGAAVNGVFSFGLLASALGTDYWYLLRVDSAGGNGSVWDAEQLSSHSGLWRLCEGRNACIPLIDPFSTESWQLPASLQHLMCMHRAFVVLLPLSLILIVFGWICGIIGSLVRSSRLLLFTGCYFLLGGLLINFGIKDLGASCMTEGVILGHMALLTLSGTSTYICYSRAAFTETVRMFDQQHLDSVHISFGWSLALALLSFATEGLAGSLLLLAARGLSLEQDACSVII